ATRFDYLRTLHGSDAVLGVLCRQGPTAEFDPEFLASLFFPCLLCTFLMGLVDSQPAALGLGRQPWQGLSQAQALVFVKSESLGHNRCPEGQDRRSVDGDGFGWHVGYHL